MKLLRAWLIVGLAAALLGGCASGGAARLTAAAPLRSGSSALSSTAGTGGVHGGAEEHLGGLIGSGASRDDFRINEASALSAHETRFAGPTPQVPIPRDGHQGLPANW